MVELNINKTYIIRINSLGKILTYQATIVTEDENFITFTDKFNTIQRFNKNVIMNIEGPINEK